MRVLSKPRLRVFWQRYPGAERPLLEWYKTASKSDWASIRDVRRAYPHADAIKLPNGAIATVFNIGGNKYRLITIIVYPFRRIYVKFVLTHSEYDREAWKYQL